MKKLKILIPFLLIFSIIAGFLSLSKRPEYSGVNYKPYDNQNKTDKEIRFDSDGKLKILHITDTHLKFNHNSDPTIWLVERACDTEKISAFMMINYRTRTEKKCLRMCISRTLFLRKVRRLREKCKC